MTIKRSSKDLKNPLQAWFKNIKKKQVLIFISLIVVSILTILIVSEVRKQLYVNELLTSYQQELSVANVTDKTFIIDGIDQTNLLFNYINAVYFDTLEKDAIQESLNTNTQKLSLYFAKYYTEEQKIQFSNIWNDYIKTFIDYTNAKKSGDTNKVREQLSKITSFPAKLASFYNSLNSNFSVDLVNLIFSDYSSTVKTIIDTYEVKDFKGVYMHRKVAVSQIEKINTLISNAIENSFK